MIPKIIHYCWFGKGEMPQLVKDCIASWHKYMPDWEYKLWNEDNFDVGSVPYAKEAYDAKKFAFVSDVVRLYVLNAFGGIYLDTDVELLKPLDSFLDYPSFLGYEGTKNLSLGTAIIGSEKGVAWIKEVLTIYYKIHFIDAEGNMDITPNTGRITQYWRNRGVNINGKMIKASETVIFPEDFFCPRKTTGEFVVTENTCCDHHFLASWKEQGSKPVFLRLVGPKMSIVLIKIKRKIFG